jgi:nitrogen regulatory protein P-II 1
MKKIEAVILREHLEAVRGELERYGLRGGLTLVEVRYSENHQSLSLMEKRAFEKSSQRIKLELIVDDAKVENVVNIILRQAQPQSQEEGGQIVVLEVNEILRI